MALGSRMEVKINDGQVFECLINQLGMRTPLFSCAQLANSCSSLFLYIAYPFSDLVCTPLWWL